VAAGGDKEPQGEHKRQIEEGDQQDEEKAGKHLPAEQGKGEKGDDYHPYKNRDEQRSQNGQVATDELPQNDLMARDRVGEGYLEGAFLLLTGNHIKGHKERQEAQHYLDNEEEIKVAEQGEHGLAHNGGVTPLEPGPGGSEGDGDDVAVAQSENTHRGRGAEACWFGIALVFLLGLLKLALIDIHQIVIIGGRNLIALVIDIETQGNQNNA